MIPQPHGRHKEAMEKEIKIKRGCEGSILQPVGTERENVNKRNSKKMKALGLDLGYPSRADQY